MQYLKFIDLILHFKLLNITEIARFYRKETTHWASICSWNICGTFPRDNPSIFGKESAMVFRRIFQNNTPGILKIGVFLNSSMNMLIMLHPFF